MRLGKPNRNTGHVSSCWMDLELLKARSLCKSTPRRAMCLLKEYYHEKGNHQTENEEGDGSQGHQTEAGTGQKWGMNSAGS